MLNGKFRIAARTSPLALKQVGEAAACIREFYLEFVYEVAGIQTLGDKDKITPISDMEGGDFFTREIDEALLMGEADFAVHSAKDLPDIMPEGLTIAAITRPLDPYDALVSKDNLKLDELPLGAKIGASSKRRKEQLKKYRPDLQIVDIRGTIGERLSFVDRPFAGRSGNGPYSKDRRDFLSFVVALAKAETPPEAGQGCPAYPKLDAVIVAACALVRLGLEERITQRVSFEILKPHPLQGSLALVAKSDKADLIKMLSKIDRESHSRASGNPKNRYPLSRV